MPFIKQQDMLLCGNSLLQERAAGQHLEQEAVGSAAGRVSWNGNLRNIWWQCSQFSGSLRQWYHLGNPG